MERGPIKSLSLSLTMALGCMVAVTSVNSTALVVVARLSYHIDSAVNLSVPVSAVQLDNNTVFSGCGAGIFVGRDGSSEWDQVMLCAPMTMDWWADCYRKKEFSAVLSPAHLWSLPGSEEIVVYDEYCGCLLRLDLTDENRAKAEVWREKRNTPYISSAALQNNLLICNHSAEGGEVLTLQRTDDPGFFEAIFKVSPSLINRLDSLGTGSLTVQPAFNPHDSTIWVAVFGHDRLVALDFNGNPVTETIIATEDWVPPRPPVSRLHSKAVWNDWLSRWTPTTSFNYAPPGYFILQYRTGWTHVANDSIPLYGTAVWNTARQPVTLELDPRWQVAGVQPDGRIIFGHYECDADSCRVVLDITRIEP